MIGFSVMPWKIFQKAKKSLTTQPSWWRFCLPMIMGPKYSNDWRLFRPYPGGGGNGYED